MHFLLFLIQSEMCEEWMCFPRKANEGQKGMEILLLIEFDSPESTFPNERSFHSFFLPRNRRSTECLLDPEQRNLFSGFRVSMPFIPSFHYHSSCPDVKIVFPTNLIHYRFKLLDPGSEVNIQVVQTSSLLFIIKASMHSKCVTNEHFLLSFHFPFSNVGMKQSKQTLDKLQTLVSAEGRFRNMREALHRCDPPCIPYLGMYLADLTFIEEGTPNYTEEGQLLNFSKMRMVIITSLQFYYFF